MITTTWGWLSSVPLVGRRLGRVAGLLRSERILALVIDSGTVEKFRFGENLGPGMFVNRLLGWILSKRTFRGDGTPRYWELTSLGRTLDTPEFRCLET